MIHQVGSHLEGKVNENAMRLLKNNMSKYCYEYSIRKHKRCQQADEPKSGAPGGLFPSGTHLFNAVTKAHT